MSNKQSSTRSVDRALDILETFLYHGKNLSLIEIANTTDLASSTAYRILSALQKRGFVSRNEIDKKYSLGIKISELGNLCNTNIDDDLRKISRYYMMDLKDKYNEDVRLFIADGNYKLCIESVPSTRSLRHIMDIGDKHTILKGAAGKVLLTYMDKSQRNKIINGSSNISDETFNKIKEKGYALSIGEKEEGLVGIAAPIINDDGNCVAALSLSGPSVRFINEEIQEKIKDTISTAMQISEAYYKTKI